MKNAGCYGPGYVAAMPVDPVRHMQLRLTRKNAFWLGVSADR